MITYMAKSLTVGNSQDYFAYDLLCRTVSAALAARVGRKLTSTFGDFHNCDFLETCESVHQFNC